MSDYINHPIKGLVEVEFRNVTITIGNAKDPQQAYDLLCSALGRLEEDGHPVEWQTDTYLTHLRQYGSEPEERSTSELFPKGE
jgi:hypothetical protein